MTLTPDGYPTAEPGNQCVVALLLDLLFRCACLASGLLSGKLHGSHEHMHNQAQDQ